MNNVRIIWIKKLRFNSVACQRFSKLTYRHGHHDLPGSGEWQTDHSSHQISPEQTALCSRSVPVVRDQHTPVLVMKTYSRSPSFTFCHIYRSVLENTLTGKACLGAPLQSSRKALGVINKVVATPAASLKAERRLNLLKPRFVLDLYITVWKLFVGWFNVLLHQCKAPAQPSEWGVARDWEVFPI